MAEKCNERIWPLGAYHSSSCGRTGKVEVNGIWYCGIHSPEAKQRREDKRKARWALHDAASEARNKAHERSAACTAAFESKDGRTIETEQISEGLFWKLMDEIQNVYEISRRGDWQPEPYSIEDAFNDLHKIGSKLGVLLNSLKVTTDE